MKTWVDLDDRGRQRLTRQGQGQVTAVSPVDGGGFRVEIDVHLPQRITRSVRYRAHAVIGPEHPLLEDACEALAWGSPVVWAIEWLAHTDIPDDVPITSLDLAVEAEARLVALNVLAVAPDPVATRMSGGQP